MGRITKQQNEIAALQAALFERNREIANLNRALAKERETVTTLSKEIDGLRNPKPAEAA